MRGLRRSNLGRAYRWSPRDSLAPERAGRAYRGGVFQRHHAQVEAGLAGFPRVEVDSVGGRRLAQGQRLGGHPPSEGPVAIHGPEGRVLGLGTVDAEGRLSPQRLFAWAVAGTAQKAGHIQ